MFGDLQGDAMTGKQLRALLEPLGIKPEATRVALHRLKNDGWITATKTGREVTYKLSELGATETSVVSPDIYRQDEKYPGGWSIYLVDDEAIDDDGSDPIIKVGRNILIAPNALDQKPKTAIAATLPDADLPAWLQNRIIDKDLLDLAFTLAALAETAHSQAHRLSVLNRILLLHSWRKMALRSNCWAHIALVPNGPIAKCHRLITQILKGTDRLTLD